MKSITLAKMVSEGDHSETRITRSVSGQAPCDHCGTRRRADFGEGGDLEASRQIAGHRSYQHCQPAVLLSRYRPLLCANWRHNLIAKDYSPTVKSKMMSGFAVSRSSTESGNTPDPPSMAMVSFSKAAAGVISVTSRHFTRLS